MGKLSKFKSSLKSAFNDSVYPGDDQIAKNIAHDEITDLQQAFQGKDWRDIPVEVAETWRMSTMLFTPQAFRYFLPAFLLGSMHEHAVEISPYLIFALIPPRKPQELAEFSETMAGFTDAQKSVIGEWVKDFLENNPIGNEEFVETTRAFWGLAEPEQA
jgi:hypothetical protein